MSYYTPTLLARHGLARAAQINEQLTAIGAAFGLLPDDQAMREDRANYVEPTGSATAWTGSLPHTVALTAGLAVRVRVPAANTSAGVTFNLNGLGTRPVLKQDGTPPSTGILPLGTIIDLVYSPYLAAWVILTLDHASTAAQSASTSASQAATSLSTMQAAGWGAGSLPEVQTAAALNGLTTTRMVCVYGAFVGTVGGPTGSLGGIVQHFHFGEYDRHQVWTDLGSTTPRSWTRNYQGSTWGAWVERLSANNLQTSTQDSTAGRLLTPGAFGLGSSSTPSITTQAALDGLNANQFVQVASVNVAAVGGPAIGSALAAGAVVQHLNFGNTNKAQIWYEVTGTGRIWRRFHSAGTWYAWRLIADGSNVVGAVTSAEGPLMELGTGYARFTSGFQVCWGNVSGLTTGAQTWTYPAAFASTPQVGHAVNSTAARIVGLATLSATALTFDVWDGAAVTTRTAASVRFLAVGSFTLPAAA